MPDLPSGSSAEPLRYQTIWVTTGARMSGMTTTSRPLSSRKLATFAPPCAEAALAPGVREATAEAFGCSDMNGLSRGRRPRDWRDFPPI